MLYLDPIDDLITHSPLTMIELLNISKTDDIVEMLMSLKNKANIKFILEHLTNKQLYKIFKKSEKSKLKFKILKRISENRLIGYLKVLEQDEQHKLLIVLPVEQKSRVIELLQYPVGSIGTIISRNYISILNTASRKDILKAIKNNPTVPASYLFIIDMNGMYQGYIPLELIFKKKFLDVKDIMLTDLLPISASEQISAVNFKQHAKIMPFLPVIDNDHKLLGIINEVSILESVEDSTLATLQMMVGVSKDEKSTSGPLKAVKKRFLWLAVNLITVIAAGAIVNAFEGTIAKITALAVLLPIISGQAGNTGAQALAVTMRGLSLKEINLKSWRFIFLKELLAGCVNGILIGCLAGIGTYLWSRSANLATIVFAAMSGTLMIAGFFGAAVPVVLKFFNKDPAVSSSIILTTLTDCAGFAVLLILATNFLY